MTKSPKAGARGMRPASSRDDYHRYDSLVDEDINSYDSDESESDHTIDDDEPQYRRLRDSRQQKYQQNKQAKAPYKLRDYRDLQSWDLTRLKIELDSLGLYCDDFERNADAPALQISPELIEGNIRSVCREFTTLAHHRSMQDRTDRLYICRGLSDQLYRLFALIAIERQYECTVCGDKKRASRFPATITKSCSHTVRTCKACVRSWTSAQLDSKGWNKIRCPECPEMLGRNDIRDLAKADTYERYSMLRRRAKDASHPDWIFCLSPKCESGQLHNKHVGNKFTCRACGFKQCVKHERKWHSGETCTEYDGRFSSKKIEEELASEKFKAKEARKCDRCGVPILKNGGCDSMWCSQCDNGFKWSNAPAYKKDKIPSPPGPSSTRRRSFWGGIL